MNSRNYLLQEKEVFQFFDRNFDDYLSVEELHQALGALENTPTQYLSDLSNHTALLVFLEVFEKNTSFDEVSSLMLEEGKEKIDYADFKAIGSNFKTTKKLSKEKLQNLLQVLDPNKNGQIDVESLRYIVKNFGEQLTATECSLLFTYLNLEEPNDGKAGKSISIKELIERLMGLSVK